MHENLEKVGPPKFTSDDIEFAKSMSESISIKEKRQTLQRYGGDIAESLMGKYLCDIIIPPFGKGQTMGGSTDVADVSWVTPTGELYIACCPLGVPGHSWQITASSGSGIGHRGLLTAAATLAMSAIDFMINPELVSRAKQEFLIKTKDNPYKSAMPTDIKPPIE